MITNIYTAVQEIMRKLKDSLTLRKFEVQSVAAQAKRLAAAIGGINRYMQTLVCYPKTLSPTSHSTAYWLNNLEWHIGGRLYLLSINKKWYC